MTTTMLAPASTRSDGPRRLPIVIGAAVVVVLVAVWVVAFSPLLGVRTVSVTGMRTLSASDIRAAAAIGHGDPLIRLDTAAVRRRVEALSGVASARVDISYPSTVRIRVTERVAVGYLARPGSGGYVLVDRSGVQYGQLDSPPPGLPHFAVPTGPAAAPTGQAVATVAAALSAPVLAQLAEISAANPQAITLVLRDGRTVLWGTAVRSQQKAALLPALLGQPGTHFDVSNPELAIVR